MRIAIGCDDAGQPLLTVVNEYLRQYPGIEVIDYSAASSDEYYPDVAERVALTEALSDRSPPDDVRMAPRSCSVSRALTSALAASSRSFAAAPANRRSLCGRMRANCSASKCTEPGAAT